MAQYSTIKITFTIDLPIGAQCGFDVNNNGGSWGIPSTYALVFNWVALRTGSGQVTQGTPTSIVGERTAINFMTAFNLDTGSQYTVTRTGNSVLIRAENVFSVTEFYVNGIFAAYTNHPSIQFDILNAGESSFNLFAPGFEQASENPCQLVKISALATNVPARVLSPLLIDPVPSLPITFDWLRGQTFNFTAESTDGVQSTIVVTTPPALNAANFNLVINNSPNGATVIANNNYAPYLLILQYSLDEINWQFENVFSGLAVGDYRFHVKDHLGCMISIDFSVNEFGVYNSFFYLSKSNPIRFAQRITWGDSANYKNDENTLSCEADVKLPYTEVQYFQSADVVKTQFKSNYAVNSMKVVKSDQTEVSAEIVKITTNIGNKEKLDAFKYNFGSGKTGIYFGAGNRYDYDSNAIIEQVALNGYLPYWGKVGNYVSIGSAWFLIEEVAYDETKNVEVLVVNSEYTGADAAVIVGCIFNFQNYEVYECAIDMLSYLNSTIRVKLECTDPHFSPITYLSELINVKVKHPKTVEIRYRNTTNTDIFYTSGIEFKIRQEISKIGGLNDQKSDVYKTDTNAVLLNADVYEADEFIFEPVTKEIMRKMLLALSHEQLYINEVGYVKNDNIDVEGPLDDTNLYVVKAKMIKNGNVYNSQASGSGNEIFNGENLQVPGLVDFGGGFVRY